jgi:hypothetical protein
MPSGTCFMDGKNYRIDYEKTNITSGVLYHGTVFQEHIFEFSFVVFNNGDPVLFSPIETAASKKNMIMNAVGEADMSASKSAETTRNRR